VPAGLSGTGSFAVQLAKRYFGAGRVVTTVSTGKVAKVEELLGEGVVDQVVDYTREDVVGAVGRGSVDFMFDTVQSTLGALAVVRKGGAIVSVSTAPSGEMMRKHMPGMPLVLVWVLDLVDWFFRTWTGWSGVAYSYLFMHPDGEDLAVLAKLVDEGKLRPVVGRTAKLSDIEGVRSGCQQIYDGKGGIGKFVIEID